MLEQPEGILHKWSENLASLSSVFLKIGDRDDVFSCVAKPKGAPLLLGQR